MSEIADVVNPAVEASAPRFGDHVTGGGPEAMPVSDRGANGEHQVVWIDLHREPRVAPNPEFPEGVDIPTPTPHLPSCKVALPYPARRIGLYVIDCKTCFATMIVTTAGRPNDPRSVTVPCKPIGG